MTTTARWCYDGEVVLITGASGGLGRALCRRYGAAGARLGLLDLDAAGVEALAGELAANGTSALPLPCDITDPAACAHAATPQEVADAIFHAGRRDQAQLVLSPTGQLSRVLGAVAPGLYQRLMARALRKELER